VTVEGELSGNLDAAGHLLVAESGRVDANLHGRNVTIAGKVHGDVTADERIELEPAAEVQGNITAPRILIKDGATFEGQVFMKSPTKTAAPATDKGGQPSKGDPPGAGDKNKK
jgi:cytoskeletal protein CcmA (bactofilin family)